MFNFFKSKFETVTLRVEGMHCASCAKNIDEELKDLEGVKTSSTSFDKQTSTVKYDPSKTSTKQIKAVITNLGYKVVT